MSAATRIEPSYAARARWISALAAAHPDDFAATLSAGPDDAQWLRAPQTGLAMVRARIGGSGAQFNLGEVAVTRCALKLADGTVGVAYVRGRDQRHARIAAWLDARLQQAERDGTLDAALALWIAPLQSARAARQAKVRAQAQTTRVDFFTVVRGDEQ